MGDHGTTGADGAEPVMTRAGADRPEGSPVGGYSVWLLVLRPARVLVPVALLVLLAQRLGAEAFHPALAVVSPVPLLAALVLGGVAVFAQASRWRVVMRGAGLPLGRREALVECYRAGALNTVLPGGVAGDVLRAWRQRIRAPKGWQPGAVSVVAERGSGLCVLLVAASAVLLVEGLPAFAAATAAMAAAAWAVTRRPLGRLSRREQTAVWGWSVVALAALLGLTMIVAMAVGVPEAPGVLASMGLLLLAGMAVPLSLGGWGPREVAGAFAAVLAGTPPELGVAIAAGYGLLATVSVLPGFLALAVPRLTGTIPRRSRQVELDAQVLAQDEATGRGAERIRETVLPFEAQAGDAVADQ